MQSRISLSARRPTKRNRGQLIESLENRQLLTGTLTSTVDLTTPTTFIPVGGTEVFNCTITPTNTGGPVPTGTVQFFSYNGVYPTQTVNVQPDGTAQLPLTGTIAGYMAYVANYSGDDNYAPASSNYGTASVNQQSIQPSLVKNTVPAAILQNAAVSGRTTVALTNPTGTKISGVQTINVFAQRYIGGSFVSTSVGKLTRNVVLAGGASKSFVIPVNMKLADSVAGDYSLVPVTTDATGASSFEIATAPGVSPAVTVSAAFVDLSATLTTVSPKSNQALPGRSVSVSLEIFNHGNVLATGNTITNFSASNNQDGSSSIFVGGLPERVRIAPGGHQIFHITKKIPVGSVPGVYYLIANVDTTNVLRESDLTNNSAISANTLAVLDPYPNLLGSFSGTARVLRGPDKSALFSQTAVVLAKDNTNGVFTETLFDPSGTGSPSVDVTGTVSTNGTITATAPAVTGKIKARLTGNVLKGSYTLGNGDYVTFMLNRQLT